jgi:S-adenosylhomocysteine hydrolase
VHAVPEKIDNEVARYALDGMGVRIDAMTKEQRHYWDSS